MAFWRTSKPTVYTNAPRHWPAVDPVQFAGPSGLLMLGVQIASALHQPPKSSVAFMRDFLYEDGILRAPIVVEEGGQRDAVLGDREARKPAVRSCSNFLRDCCAKARLHSVRSPGRWEGIGHTSRSCGS